MKLSEITNNYSQEEIDKIEDEALSWMIKLQETPNDQSLLNEFKSWLYKSPLHAELWAQFGQVTDLLQEQTIDKTKHNNIPPVQQSGKPKKPQLYHYSFQKYAAIFTIFIVSALLISYLPNAIMLAQADYSTATGETKVIHLKDGSIINLGASSAINVNYSDDLREIDLLTGQAFFKVAKAADRPFKVLTSNSVTMVTGTSFEVNKALKSTIVSVVEGEVLVNPAAQKVAHNKRNNQLHKGERIKISNSGEALNSQVKIQNIAAWRTGKLVVLDRSVKDVIHELQRHYKGLIINSLGSIGHKRISGVYDLSNPEKVLKIIAATHGAKTRQISKWIFVLSKF